MLSILSPPVGLVGPTSKFVPVCDEKITSAPDVSGATVDIGVDPAATCHSARAGPAIFRT